LVFVAASARAFDVTDALGRTVSFEEPPERIVIAGRAVLLIADAVYMFPAATEKVAAVEKITQGAKNFIPIVDEEYENKIVLPRMVGAEEIMAVQPDLVLLKTYMRNRLGRPLERLGVPVVYLNFETPGEYLEEVRTLGKLLGNPVRAEEIKSFYTSRLTAVERLAAPIQEGEKPAVLFLSYSDRGGTVTFNVPPGEWLQARLIENAGGVPAWTRRQKGNENTSGGWRKVGIEQIAGWDPEYIIVTSYFSNVDDVIDRLYADPVWRNLDAVKENRLYGFPADFFSWDQPDTRWVLGLMWLAKQLYPDRLKDLDMREEVYVFYGKLYGLDRETVDDHIFPLLRGDLNGVGD